MGFSSDPLGGIKVYISDHVGQRVQFRKPRSKRRRIRKKWENYRPPQPRKEKGTGA